MYSPWRVVLLWYHRFCQSSVQSGRHTKLWIISSLKWIIQICSKFYCWGCFLLTQSTLLFGETPPFTSHGPLPSVKTALRGSYGMALCESVITALLVWNTCHNQGFINMSEWYSPLCLLFWLEVTKDVNGQFLCHWWTRVIIFIGILFMANICLCTGYDGEKKLRLSAMPYLFVW